MRRVWPDTTVEEGNLTFNISSLRKGARRRPAPPRVHRDDTGRGLSVRGGSPCDV